ncbi:hypothetical protein [Oceaniglobus roseus]|uniref:hypothetical protein n=1 Tax=Oceaniglobus roseus TaxID=1737570 RepID=UPI000C7F1775|nr:hypothetical protein [Kandeliimicrobium roseum]
MARRPLRPLLVALALASPLSAAAEPLALTTPEGTPFDFALTIDCGGRPVSQSFRVYADGMPRPGAEILAGLQGPMAEAADPDDLAQVMETASLAGSDCDVASNLSPVSPQTALVADTARAAGSLWAGARLADLRTRQEADARFPVTFADDCRARAAASGTPGPEQLSAALDRIPRVAGALAKAAPGSLDRQFLLGLDQSAFALSTALARCAFAQPFDATLPATLDAQTADYARLAAMIAADAKTPPTAAPTGDWRLTRRGWGAHALVPSEAGPSFGYYCEVDSSGGYRWSFVVSGQDNDPTAELVIDGTPVLGRLFGESLRRFADSDRAFQYLALSEDSGDPVAAIRAARTLALRINGEVIDFSSRGSAAAIGQARDHCAASAVEVR